MWLHLGALSPLYILSRLEQDWRFSYTLRAQSPFIKPASQAWWRRTFECALPANEANIMINKGNGRESIVTCCGTNINLLKISERFRLNSWLVESEMAVAIYLSVPTKKSLNYNWLANLDPIQYGIVLLYKTTYQTRRHGRKYGMTAKFYKGTQKEPKLQRNTPSPRTMNFWRLIPRSYSKKFHYVSSYNSKGAKVTVQGF